MKDSLTEIGERMRAYLAIKKIGVNQLGRLSGTSGAQISKMLSGRSYNILSLLAIADVCPDLNVQWLIRGEGEMITPEGPPQAVDWRNSGPEPGRISEFTSPSGNPEPSPETYVANDRVYLDEIRQLRVILQEKEHDNAGLVAEKARLDERLQEIGQLKEIVRQKELENARLVGTKEKLEDNLAYEKQVNAHYKDANVILKTIVVDFRTLLFRLAGGGDEKSDSKEQPERKDNSSELKHQSSA